MVDSSAEIKIDIFLKNMYLCGMDENELKKLVEYAASLSVETEWIEFKHNFHSNEEIGERISAIANSACLLKQPFGYLIFGIEDTSHAIIGTTFHARTAKKGNEELEMWLVNRLNPRIDIEVIEFDYDSYRHISLYRIPAATNRPVTFLNEAYIRIGSITQKLSKYPEKEAKIWRNNPQKQLDQIILTDQLDITDIPRLLHTEAYFNLLGLPLPQNLTGIIDRFKSEKFIIQNLFGYGITQLGAILFAKQLQDFPNLNRKAVRIIVYKSKNKTETVREKISSKGYAVEFEEIIDWINGQLPANEEIGKALRRNVRMYPEIAVRELFANAIIHQDFSEQGFPVIEIYPDRIEISNAGLPVIDINRFIDEYQSRNDALADVMRRLGFCEEKGSGWDKAVSACELYQLPPILTRLKETRTCITLFGYRKLSDIEREERIAACYQHACLKYVSNEKMTNQSLRERLGIEEHNAAIASRIIKETLNANLIKEDNPDNGSRKYKKYIPYWG